MYLFCSLLIFCKLWKLRISRISRKNSVIHYNVLILLKWQLFEKSFFHKCWKFRKMLVLYQKIVSSKWALWINQNSIYQWHDIDDHEKKSDEHIFHSSFKKFHFSHENLLDFVNSDGFKTKYAMIWYHVSFLSHFHQSRVNKH